MSGAQSTFGGSPATRPGLLAFAFLGGFVAWLGDLVVSWALVPVACNAGVVWPLHAVAAASALIAGGALMIAIAARRRLSADARASRPAFMARVGTGLNALALLAIAFMWLLLVLIEPCAGNQEFPLWLF